MPWGGGRGVPSQVQLGGVPISHNALQHYPEFHGADTWGGGGVPSQVQVGGGYPARSGQGVPCRGIPCLGTPPSWPGVSCREVPCRGDPTWVPTLTGGYPARGVPHPGPGQDGGGGYPVRTTEGVLTTRQAVCLLRSRRRTFLYFKCFHRDAPQKGPMSSKTLRICSLFGLCLMGCIATDESVHTWCFWLQNVTKTNWYMYPFLMFI